MPRYVVKHGDKVLVWSTIVDAPVTHACSIAGMRRFWKREYGRQGLEELDKQIARGLPELADEVCGNRAGAGETELTLEQLVAHYVENTDPSKPPPRGKRR